MNIKYSLAALLVFASASTALGQTTGSQKFTVTVPTGISITPPGNVALTHDESENNQAFPAQAWTVRGNSLAGVTVSLSTTKAFTHITDTTSKRNAQIGLAVNSSIGSGAWTVTQASDVTDYANNDEVATVQATSNGFGRAVLDVSVSFITDGFGSFAAGEYDSIVTGTVTAN